MKAVILAAGMGRRLAPMGWQKPKCLLPFGDRTLLDHVAITLLENGIDRLVVVVGYQANLVLGALAEHATTNEIVLNADYADTNTIHSLYLARHYLDDDFLYFNADVLFDRRIVAMLLERTGSVLAIDEKACGDEEVKVVVDDHRRVVRIGKELPSDRCMGEFIGVGRFDRSACEPLIASLCGYNEQPEQRNLFFEAALQDILDRHVFMAESIGDLVAVEIDTPEDYEEARRAWASGKMSV